MENIRILIDTNIFIYSEDYAIPDESIMRLHSLCSKHRISMLLHSKTRKEIENDENNERKRIMLQKINKYPGLEFDEEPTIIFNSQIGTSSKPNDQIDAYMLFALERNAAFFLVTEDKGIHSKAIKANLEDRVFTVEDFIQFIESKYEQTVESLPKVLEKLLSQISIEDSIFNTLKSDYAPDFLDWYSRKSREGRKAWVTYSGEKVSGICIYDPKNEGCNNKMKLCTFKVDEDFQGSKIGELLLYQALLFAYQNNLPAIQITVLTDKPAFIEWLKSFGFIEVGMDQSKKIPELILEKIIQEVPRSADQDSNALETSIKHMPYYVEPPHVNAHIVPIQPRYTRILFPDIEEQAKLLDEEPCGNALKKAYICNSNTTKIQKGDLLFFYESRRKRALIAVGFVEDYLRSQDPYQILSYVGRRSVYYFDDIISMTNEREAISIKFIYAHSLKNEVNLDTMIQNGVIQSSPQTIQQISDYSKLKKLI